LEAAKKLHFGQECVIVKLCSVKHCELRPAELPDTWTSFLPDV
jgi:hypothetical protein